MSIWLVAKCTLNEALLFCDEGLTGVGKFFIFKDIAVIVYGSLVPSIVEQNLFRAHVKHHFLDCIALLCAAMKSSSS